MRVMQRIGVLFVAVAMAMMCVLVMADSAKAVSAEEAKSAVRTTTATLSSDQKTITAQAYGGDLASSNLVKFAVWSDNKGQNDLRWYTAKKSGGVWTAQVPVANHKDAGLYKIDAYYRVPGSTTEKGLGRSTVAVSTPTATVTFSQTEDQKSRGTFTVTASNIASPSGVQRVQIPIWSVANGQDDLVWYDAKQSGSNWTVEAPCVGGKRTAGSYKAHVYVTCGNGVVSIAGRVTADATLGPIRTTATLSSDQKTITAQAYGGDLASSNLVKFAVWSDNKGQNDLRWYTAKKSGGVWTAQVPVANHKDAGLYKIDAYYRVPGSKTEKGLGRSTVTVSAPTAKVSITASGNGFYRVGISGVSSPSGVAAVEVPTWTVKNGQDDLIWHKTGRLADGSWYSVLDAYIHKGEDGTYISHVYVTCGNGVKAAVGVVNFNMKAENYVYVTGASGSGTRNVWIKNPTSTSNVKAAVWSTAGGQDDLKWYNAVNKGSNLYQITINCKNLKHAGAVKVHVYAGNKHIVSTNFSAVAADIPDQKYSAVDSRIAWMGSNTNYLIAVDTTKCFVRVYQGWAGNWKPVKTFSCAPGAASTPTVKGQFTIQNKGYVFGSGYSCYYWTQFYGNYLFHSILYNPGTLTVQDGTMGRPASHGCVRLNIENAKWIQDVIPRGTKVYVF